jgi:hypothetical protein
MFSYKISRWFLLFLILTSCSTKEQVKEKLPVKQKAITTFEEQEIKPKEEEKKPSKRIYESYIFRKLSNSFDFRIRWNYEQDNYFGIGVPLVIDICHKKDSSKQQTIISNTEWLFADKIKSNVSSFETRINLKKSISQDSPYYFVVGDYNFDSLVDFVVVNNIPPCSGTPTYNFYFQKSDSTFYLNEQFTNQILFMPEKMNPNSRSFNITSYSGCCFNEYKTYQIQENGRIKLIRHKKNDCGKTVVLL